MGEQINMQCNICGSSEFFDMRSRKQVRCAGCNSLERTRLIALMIEKYIPINRNTKILHIAPEPTLALHFHSIAGDNCTFVDLEPERFKHIPQMKRLDLCSDLPLIESNSYDIIIHSHVLEHLPCNYTYVLFHLHRIMTESAKMICSIPFLPGYFDGCTDPALSRKERLRRFGQRDHITCFGVDDLQMSLGKVYDLPANYDARDYIESDTLIKHNVPETIWTGYSPHSVLILGKNDYKLA